MDFPQAATLELWPVLPPYCHWHIVAYGTMQPPRNNLKPVLTLTINVMSPGSCDQNSDSWQPACIYIIAASWHRIIAIYNLFQGVSDRQNQGVESLDSLKDCSKNGLKIWHDSLNHSIA